MRKIDELKLRRKELACAIKSKKAELRLAGKNRISVCDASRMRTDLLYMKLESRALHIAYCELRGRRRDEIEKPREGNAPNEYMIQNLKNQYAWETAVEDQK